MRAARKDGSKSDEKEISWEWNFAVNILQSRDSLHRDLGIIHSFGSLTVFSSS